MQKSSHQDSLFSGAPLDIQNVLSKLHVVLLFLDGVGIGKKDSNVNPFFRARMPALTSICGGELPHIPLKRHSSDNAEVISINATLGVEGFPQSGTGQTALFTGVNGAKIFGRHFGPHPPSILRPVIAEKNIFQQIKHMGKSAIFANAFPQQFFDYTESGTRRLTVTTLSCQYANVPLLSVRELQQNDAVSADIIRGGWSEMGYTAIRQISPQEAGRHLIRIASHYDFTLFEYWLTDHAGHSQKMNNAVDILERFDEFLSGMMDSFDQNNMLLILVSDHGNIEDLSTRSHTRNRVPCILIGKESHRIAHKIKNLMHVTPAIISLLNNSRE